MPAVKIQGFLGIAPKVAPQLLKDSAAQDASNVKLYSGDLIPYRTPSLAGTTFRSGEVKTIYPLRDPATDDIVWLSWATDVDVAVATSLNDEEQRIYYTGDGVPKVTNYAKAVSGGGPYPAGYYTLGLPLPTAVPSASASSFSQLTVSSYARDSGNVATLTFASAHNLKSGAIVTVSGFNDTSPDTTPFNLTNTSITVTSTTAFKYYNVGSTVSTASTDTDGRVDLAGGTISRSYVYTWITPWGEESVPSEPSDAIFIKEGQVVTVSNLPNSAPGTPTNNFIRGIRVYRTVISTAGSDYFRLRTLWFPNTIDTYARTSNVATVKFDYVHNLEVDDKIKISGATNSSFNVTDGTVLSVVDDYTITYASSGSDVSTTSPAAGTLYYNMAEPGSTTYTYYESTTFTDNYDINGLIFTLESLDYDAPDSAMQGLTVAHNNILVGFVGNELCFSEPGKPWAWPFIYRLVFESEIVAIASAAETILVLTKKYPYIVTGNTPANMSQTRIDAPYPCTSKRGVVNMGYGAIFPTHGGLGVWGPSAGMDIITKIVHDWDTWEEAVDNSNIVSEFYANKYFGSHPSGSFIFEQDSETGGNLVTTPYKFTAAYYEARDDAFYYVPNTDGSVYRWDDPAQPLTSISWKSKVIDTQTYLNIGAARVIADYAVDTAEAEAIATYNAAVVTNNTLVWTLVDQLGTLNGPDDYVDPDTSAYTAVMGTLNSSLLNGDMLTQYQLTETGNFPVSFLLWADGNLIATVTVGDNEIFRLPTGYRSDKFEVAVSGSARVKAIHLGETPLGLRTA